MEILITEGQLKRIIAEQTKPTPVKPKNKTYTTVQDRVLTRDALTGSITIPKGTRFTAHQDGDRKSGPQPTYTASVDRIVNGKRKPSTVFYCTGKNAGKFWNGSSNSWYYDKTKVNYRNRIIAGFRLSTERIPCKCCAETKFRFGVTRSFD